MPFGQVRYLPGSPAITSTDFGYTGQRDLDPQMGLMDYKARFYSPLLGRFVQPDTVIPNIVAPQTWNRFSYTINNPILYNDPDGHCGVLCVFVLVAIPFFLSGDTGPLPPPKVGVTEIKQIRDTSHTSADALVTMFTTDNLPGNTPKERLEVILNATHNGNYSHFAIEGFNSSGFKDELQDPDPNNNQVGHFLTAVDISLNQDNLLGVSALVGHEMYADGGSGTPFIGLMQTALGLASPKDRKLFFEGTDDAFNTILKDGSGGPFNRRNGNSIEDLRLTYLGWQMAQKYKNKEFPNNNSVGKWLKKNISQ